MRGAPGWEAEQVLAWNGMARESGLATVAPQSVGCAHPPPGVPHRGAAFIIFLDVAYCCTRSYIRAASCILGITTSLWAQPGGKTLLEVLPPSVHD